MRSRAPLCITLGAAFALGCATNPALQQARQTYEQAAGDESIDENAPVELYQAKQTLEKAEKADSDRTIRHYSELAEKRIEIARIAARANEDERSLREFREARQEYLLSARSAEARSAQQRSQELEQQIASLSRQLEAEQARGATVASIEAQLRELGARETERGQVLTLSDVFFEFDESTLTAAARRELDPLATFLRAHPDQVVVIEGHTDSVGPEGYNEGLSQRRAQAVQQYLASRGIDPSRVETRGLGELVPIASNETTTGRQMNRRVEIMIPGASLARMTPPAERSSGSSGSPPAVSAGPPGGSESSGSDAKSGMKDKDTQSR